VNDGRLHGESRRDEIVELELAHEEGKHRELDATPIQPTVLNLSQRNMNGWCRLKEAAP
jgi:hypothetical protein